MKIINATFAEAVKTPRNGLDSFVHASPDLSIDYVKEESAVYLRGNGKTVIVFSTNIRHMEADEQTSGTSAGTKTAGSGKKS